MGLFRFISRRILPIALCLQVAGCYAGESSGERRTFEGPFAEPGGVASYYQSQILHLDVPTPIPSLIPPSTPTRDDFQKGVRTEARNIVTQSTFRPQLQSPSTSKPYPLDWQRPQSPHPSQQTFVPHRPAAAYYRGGPNPSVKTPEDDVILRNPAPTPQILNPTHVRSNQKAQGVRSRPQLPSEGSSVTTTGRTYEDKVRRGEGSRNRGRYPQVIGTKVKESEEIPRSRPTGIRRYPDKKGLRIEKRVNSEVAGERGRTEINGRNEPRGYAVAGANDKEIVSEAPAKERQRQIQERRNDGRYRVRGGDSGRNRNQEIEEEGARRDHDRNEEGRKRIDEMGRGDSERRKRPRRLPEDEARRGRADDAQETVQKHTRSRPEDTQRPVRTEEYSSDNTNRHLRRRKQRPFARERDEEEDGVEKAEESSKDEVKASESEEDQSSKASHHHKEEGGGEKKHEEGGGEEEEEEHHESHGEESEKGYKGEHKYDKAAEGKHGKEEHKGEEEEEGGHKEGHHESGDYFGEEHEEHKGEKSEGFEDEGKYKKGHSTKGTHEVHKKDEYANKHEFFDDYEDDGHHDKEGAFEEDEKGEKGGHHKKEHHDSAFDHGEHHKKGKHLKGHYYDEEEGHDHKDGEEEEHQHKEEYGKKEGHKKHIKKEYSEEDGGGKE